MEPDKWSINYSWTQPYRAYYSVNPIKQSKSIEQELARLDMVDGWVDAMLTYPDAERILNKIKEKPND